VLCLAVGCRVTDLGAEPGTDDVQVHLIPVPVPISILLRHAKNNECVRRRFRRCGSVAVTCTVSIQSVSTSIYIQSMIPLLSHLQGSFPHQIMPSTLRNLRSWHTHISILSLSLSSLVSCLSSLVSQFRRLAVSPSRRLSFEPVTAPPPPQSS
jgi:hypothetical protein